MSVSVVSLKVSARPRGVRLAVTVAMAAIVATGLAGCGRRGQLEPAPDPTVQAAAPSDGNSQAMERRPKRVPIKPPHESFFLDPLL
ncbi:hypothetical protein [Lichenihabitans psoromatis]|uniref:hypothetical protein n=1 Tax=Lichenihabitans psoromatis TaxID=2528642 RepID=UPI0010355BAA|nr:hypothetical protein [Lichenihabitans psoromatis]